MKCHLTYYCPIYLSLIPYNAAYYTYNDKNSESHTNVVYEGSIN